MINKLKFKAHDEPFRSKAEWLYCILSLLLGWWWLAPRIQVLIKRIPKEMLDPNFVDFTYGYVAFIFIYCVVLLWSALGSSKARVILMLFFLMMSCLAVVQIFIAEQEIMFSSTNDFSLLKYGKLWIFESTLWLFWIVFSYWFLFKRDPGQR